MEGFIYIYSHITKKARTKERNHNMAMVKVHDVHMWRPEFKSAEPTKAKHKSTNICNPNAPQWDEKSCLTKQRKREYVSNKFKSKDKYPNLSSEAHKCTYLHIYICTSHTQIRTCTNKYAHSHANTRALSHVHIHTHCFWHVHTVKKERVLI